MLLVSKKNLKVVRYIFLLADGNRAYKDGNANAEFNPTGLFCPCRCKKSVDPMNMPSCEVVGSLPSANGKIHIFLIRSVKSNITNFRQLSEFDKDPWHLCSMTDLDIEQVPSEQALYAVLS